jgi:cardiolipin synthase
MTDRHKNAIITIPNFISISRVLLIPVFLYMMLNGKILNAFIVFLIAASTDFLDGATARLLNQKTKLGVLLDPMGDKALMAAAFIILSVPKISIPNTIPGWLTITVIGRDIFLVIGAFVLFKLIGQKTFTPVFLGKISTVCQMGVLLLVLFHNVTKTYAPSLSWFYLLTLVFTILSGIQYFYIGLTWLLQYRKS